VTDKSHRVEGRIEMDRAVKIMNRVYSAATRRGGGGGTFIANVWSKLLGEKFLQEIGKRDLWSFERGENQTPFKWGGRRFSYGGRSLSFPGELGV